MNSLTDLRDLGEAVAAHDMGRIRTLLVNWTPPTIAAWTAQSPTGPRPSTTAVSPARMPAPTVAW